MASSSIGLSEQVEYTILPPTASCSTPRTAIRSCSLVNTHIHTDGALAVSASWASLFFFYFASSFGRIHLHSGTVASPWLTRGGAGCCWSSISSTHLCFSSWSRLRCRAQGRTSQIICVWMHPWVSDVQEVFEPFAVWDLADWWLISAFFPLSLLLPLLSFPAQLCKLLQFSYWLWSVSLNWLFRTHGHVETNLVAVC